MWTYNGVRIYVTDMSEGMKQTIARLQPLREGTVHHIFGWESPTAKITGYIVGADDKTALESFTTSGASMELDSNYGVLGNYFLSAVDCKLTPTIKQTLDITKDCESPVYITSLELFKDE